MAHFPKLPMSAMAFSSAGTRSGRSSGVDIEQRGDHLEKPAAFFLGHAVHVRPDGLQSALDIVGVGAMASRLPIER